jgi:hypothetical protein
MSKKDSHKDRMRRLEEIAAPPKGTHEWDRLMGEIESKPTVAKREISKRYKLARASVQAQLNSGAGRFADEALREFLTEYNHRTWNYGLRSLPMSFNVLEPLFNYDEENNFFRLLPEIDYLFSIEDFVDFSTQPTTRDASLADAKNLKEGVIYNYSAYDDPTILSFQMNDGIEYILASVSMLRRGPELTVLVTAGEKGQREQLNRICLWDSVKYSEVVPDESLPDEPIMLKGAPDFVKAYAACRFDLDAMTVQVRYLMLDAGRFFEVYTDDPDGLASMTEEKQSELLNANSDKLDTRATLWELAKTVVLLPSYIQARIEFVKDESQSTALALQAKNSLKVRLALEGVRPAEKVLYRRISAIRIIRPASPSPVGTGRAYTPPQFMVPVQGYWRVFMDSDRSGHDEAGNPVSGKTWVRPHTRYTDRPEAPKVIYIKSSLAYARRQLESYHKKMGYKCALSNEQSEIPGPLQPLDSEAPGYLYVFRSPAHGRDIYKVGYTDRDPESRARELSSASGNPVPFLVVQAWAVVDPRAAEVAAHEALANYRLASNREFFVGQYALLRELIERAIEGWLI